MERGQVRKTKNVIKCSESPLPFFRDKGSVFRVLKQGQPRGYGRITQQYLSFGRTTGGQHFQLKYLQRYLKNCFASFIL